MVILLHIPTRLPFPVSIEPWELHVLDKVVCDGSLNTNIIDIDSTAARGIAKIPVEPKNSAANKHSPEEGISEGGPIPLHLDTTILRIPLLLVTLTHSNTHFYIATIPDPLPFPDSIEPGESHMLDKVCNSSLNTNNQNSAFTSHPYLRTVSIEPWELHILDTVCNRSLNTNHQNTTSSSHPDSFEYTFLYCYQSGPTFRFRTPSCRGSRTCSTMYTTHPLQLIIVMRSL